MNTPVAIPRHSVLVAVIGPLALLALLHLGTCTLSMANDLAEGYKAKGKQYYWGLGVQQDLRTALEYYNKAAAIGDAEAQYISGGMYFKGMGTARNFGKAFSLLQKAAEQGKSNPESQKIIAQAYLLGSGVPKNYDKALYWYTRAAASGDPEAQNELGFMYFVGRGVERDLEKGADYFLQAAEGDLTIAQYNIGIIYYTGNGVETADLSQAYAWLNVAAAKGHQPSIAARDSLETVLSPSELEAAQQLSTELRESIGR